MQKTETVLKIYSERGKEGKAINRLYRQLFNPELYQYAYSEIYANSGALTRGTSEDTMDGMSVKRMNDIIGKMKSETYKWEPVRRTYIPKADGKDRPLGIPSGDDKLLQAAMKTLLEHYYEPQFSDNSHGFRSKRGVHTALRRIRDKHNDVAWFIEGDIKGCFDNIDHDILMEILAENIKDGRMLRLIRNLLEAGYMNYGIRYDTKSGAPQGGIISPLLTNVYLNELDKWVENDLMPRYNRSLQSQGKKGFIGRRNCPEYKRLEYRETKARKAGNPELAKKYRKMRKPMPSIIVNDEGYRKLAYIRYADDILLSFAGPKCEAEQIKEELRVFLKDRLNLELSIEKTLITHARTEKARFLGYDISIMHGYEKKNVNGNVWFGVPKDVIGKITRNYTKKGKPSSKPERRNDSDYDIISRYQQEYRGYVEFYQIAYNLRKLSIVNKVIETSMLMTLATKFRMSVTQVADLYRTTKKHQNGKTYRTFEAKVTREKEGLKPLTAYFGAVPLKRKDLSKVRNIKDGTFTPVKVRTNDLIRRLLAEECEMCGTENVPLEAHHVRKLKDLKRRKKKQLWEKVMIARQRKTLMVCWKCHSAIHNGEYRSIWDKHRDSAQSRVR